MNIHQTPNTITKVEFKLVTYNLHCLSVLQQAKPGKEAALE